MTIPVSFFLALAVMILSYASGNGGPVAGLLFFTVLFLGALIHYAKPLIEKLKP